MTEREQHHLGEDLAAMVDGGASLSDARRQELESHLESCVVCRGAIEQARTALDLLSGPGIEPSQGFDRALYARLDAIDEKQASSLSARLARFFTPPRVLTAAAAAAAVFAIVHYPRKVDPPGTAGPQEPSVESLAQVEVLEMAEDLELYENLDVVSELDVLEDLEVIEALEVEKG
jgi:anti-sigma factor RsiW